ncbi:MAG TPA: hypothetical protein VGP56_08310 [Gaiellaceae bacterium]|nr:hypothetical protein [Gaiellaceae bacterium]
MTVRLLLWNVGDSKTTLDELRAKLPELPEGDVWISDPAGERFGLISFSEDDEPAARARELIGKDPEVGEEFELED